MSQEIVRQQQRMTMQDTLQFANAVYQGSLLPRDYRGNAANVVIAVNLGQSMGLSPAESLYRISVIQGKPTASAELIAAQVRKAGHKLRIKKDERAMSVTATIVRQDDPDYPISVTRDMEWAKRMGLSGKDNYRKQPMTMLTWRAITAVAREACPEALYGVAYTPDEMHDMDPEPAQQVAVAQPQQQPQTKAKGTLPPDWQEFMRAMSARYAKAQGCSPNDAAHAIIDACGDPVPTDEYGADVQRFVAVAEGAEGAQAEAEPAYEEPGQQPQEP